MEKNPPDSQEAVEKQAGIKLGVLREDIGFQIHITRRALAKSLRAQRKGGEKREPSGYISSLILIGENPGISQQEIAEVLVIDPPNLVAMLNRMVREKLIVRTRDERDRRRFLLKLTETGEERVRFSKEFSRLQRERYKSLMSHKEIEQLSLLLEKVQACLKDKP